MGYTTYTENEKFKIGKYTSENGNLTSLTRLHINFKESTVKNFQKQYNDELNLVMGKTFKGPFFINIWIY